MLPNSKLLSAPITKLVQQCKYSTEATLKTFPFLLHKLKEGPQTTSTLSKKKALHLYKEMQMVRNMERLCAQLYQSKHIRGFCHLYTGQEAICVAMKSCLRPQDSVITAYRCHGWAYMMGLTVLEVVAELTGRNSGNARGKGGSMHIYGKKFFGGNGIVGGQIPLGAGVGLAHKYRGDGGICVACYGDGAANNGQVFEAFNMAKLWKLPCLFVCENNGYAIGTAANRSSASTKYYTRGDYIPGVWADGMDIPSVIEATKYCINYVVKNGPLVLECNTYRYFGHSMSDPGISYRSREEIQKVRKTRDCIAGFREKLLKSALGTEVELKKIETEVSKFIEGIGKAATADREIDLIELGYDIYAKSSVPVRGVDVFKPWQHKTLGKPFNMQ